MFEMRKFDIKPVKSFGVMHKKKRWVNVADVMMMTSLAFGSVEITLGWVTHSH